MIHCSYTCKVCNKPGTAEMCDEYEALGDPFKLMKLLTCDRCESYVIARRKIFRRVKVLCELLIQRAVNKDDMVKARESLETLTKRYMRLYAAHYDLALADYEPEIVDALMSRPTHFGQVLGRIPKLFAQRALI